MADSHPDVAAHTQAVAHHYSMHYPEHPARTDDPHYVDFEHIRTEWKKDPQKWRCAIGAHRGDFSECDSEHPLELHHAHVEFALQNGIDLAWLEKDYPGISDPANLGAWVESGANLVVLCVVPDSPVLMADGTEKPIQDISVGDLVVGGDGVPDLVVGTARKHYRGEIIVTGDAALTTDHQIQTCVGWRPIGEIANQIGVLGDDVIAVRRVEQEVVGRVVGTIPVNVMYAFRGQKLSSDPFFHNQGVFHSASPSRNRDPNITFRGNGADTIFKRFDTTGERIETDHPTGVRTIDLFAPPNTGWGARQRRATDITRDSFYRTPTNAPSPSAALSRTGGIAVAERTRNQELVTTDRTDFDFGGTRFSAHGFWDSTFQGTSWQYSGYVYDISIARSHSFVVNGIVAHNCAFHHRGHGGVHVASASDFEAEKYVKGLIS